MRPVLLQQSFAWNFDQLKTWYDMDESITRPETSEFTLYMNLPTTVDQVAQVLELNASGHTICKTHSAHVVQELFR